MINLTLPFRVAAAWRYMYLCYRTASFLKSLLHFYDRQEPPAKGERTFCCACVCLRYSIGRRHIIHMIVIVHAVRRAGWIRADRKLANLSPLRACIASARTVMTCRCTVERIRLTVIRDREVVACTMRISRTDR